LNTATARHRPAAGPIAGPRPELGIIDIRQTPHVEIAEINPEMAASMLAHNTHNRSLRLPRVTQLANAIRNGDWRLAPDCIMFDTEGVLRNGQHRLAAIVDADQPAVLIILTGVSADSQEVTDIGLARRLSDVLQLRGEAQSNSLSAMLVALHRLRHAIRTGSPNVSPNQYPTPQALLAIYETEPGLKASITASRLASMKVTKRHGATAALHFVFAGLPDETASADADAFMYALATGLELTEDDPIYALRRYIIGSQPRPDAARMNALTIKAWNAWRQGQPLRVLSYKQGGSLREAFPVPR